MFTLIKPNGERAERLVTKHVLDEELELEYYMASPFEWDDLGYPHPMGESKFYFADDIEFKSSYNF